MSRKVLKHYHNTYIKFLYHYGHVISFITSYTFSSSNLILHFNYLFIFQFTNTYTNLVNHTYNQQTKSHHQLSSYSLAQLFIHLQLQQYSNTTYLHATFSLTKH